MIVSRRLGIAVLCAGLAAPAVAGAQQKRVVLARLDGAPSPAVATRLRMAIEGVLSIYTEVVPARLWDDAVRRLGITVRGPDDVGQLAREVDADAVLEASLERATGGWSLTVGVRNGSDGDLLGRESFALASATSLGALNETLWERLASVIQQTSAQAPSVQIPPAPRFRGPERFVAPAEVPRDEARSDFLRPSLRVGFANRAFETRFVASPPRTLALSGFPFVGLDVEVAPLHPLGGPSTGIVIHGAYAHSFGVTASAEGAMPGTTVPIDIAWQTFQVDLGYRYPFQVYERTMEVTLLLGWGAQQFFLGGVEALRADLKVFTMDYQFISIQPRLSYEIVPAWRLRAGLSFALRPVVSVGSIVREQFGEKTGGGFGWTAGVFGTTEIPGLSNFYFGLSADYGGYSVKYVGAAVEPADSSSDMQFRLDLIAGYRLP